MVAQRIARLRTQQNMTQKELARRCGVSETTIKNWESGANEPHLEHIRQLCMALNTNADFLLGINEKRMICVDGLEDVDIDYIKQLIQMLYNKNFRNKIK